MERTGKAAPEVILAVWTAEDGRCEACTRPMDRRWARVTRIDQTGEYTVENLQLVCVDCSARRPDPLADGRIVLGDDVAARVLGQLPPEQLAQATRWLGLQLKRYGVILWVGKVERTYWLPGVATFRLLFRADGTAVVTDVSRLTAELQVKVKPQERTRGLSKPDRSPWRPKRQAV